MGRWLRTAAAGGARLPPWTIWIVRVPGCAGRAALSLHRRRHRHRASAVDDQTRSPRRTPWTDCASLQRTNASGFCVLTRTAAHGSPRRAAAHDHRDARIICPLAWRTRANRRRPVDPARRKSRHPVLRVWSGRDGVRGSTDASGVGNRSKSNTTRRLVGGGWLPAAGFWRLIAPGRTHARVIQGLAIQIMPAAAF